MGLSKGLPAYLDQLEDKVEIFKAMSYALMKDFHWLARNCTCTKCLLLHISLHPEDLGFEIAMNTFNAGRNSMGKLSEFEAGDSGAETLKMMKIIITTSHKM